MTLRPWVPVLAVLVLTTCLDEGRQPRETEERDSPPAEIPSDSPAAPPPDTVMARDTAAH